MDRVGPLEETITIFRYILVILDCATRFPEAIPLWNITAWAIVAKIFQVFA